MSPVRPSARKLTRLAVALGLLSFAFAGCPLPFGPKKVGVRVSSADGFKPGTPVILKGVPVAKVIEVVIEDGRPTLIVEFDHEHRDTLKTGADLRLRTPGLFGGGDHAVMIEDAGQGEPLPAGARLDAQTAGGAIIKQASEALRGAADALEGALGAAKDAESDAKKILEEAGRAAEQARKAGADAVAKLRNETLPKVEKELKALEESLRKAGKTAEAEGIREELRKLLEGK